jgi:Right handed beta helix region
VQIQHDKILKKLRRTLTWRQLSALARLPLMLAMSAVLVQGRTYYVSFTQGADTNAGTVSAPWKTIARLNAQPLQPGDVVAFKRGETWHETLRPRSSGIAKLPIIFRAYGVGPPPTFSGTSHPGKDINIDNNEQSYIIYKEMNLQGARQGLRVYAWRAHVRGIILENSVISTEVSEPRGTMSAGVYASVGSGTISNIVIRDNEFHPHPTGSENWGVYFVKSVVDFRIERNSFTPAGEDAICVWHSARGVIARNRGGHNGENTIDVKDSDDIAITENSAESDGEYNIVVHTVDPSSRTRRIVVSENHCRRAGQRGQLTAGIALLFVENTRIAANLIDDPQGAGIYVRDANADSGNDVVNNVIRAHPLRTTRGVFLEDAPGTQARGNNSVTAQRLPR